MKTVVVTGSSGLVGSESVRFFCEKGFYVVGIDNDLRQKFFGPEASTLWQGEELRTKYKNFELHSIDIRDADKVDALFNKFGSDISLVIHAAAQPSHDWAAKEPFTDFTVNANGTLSLLEATRKRAPDAPFIFTSTNKVYGDNPNLLPLVELETRWEIDSAHPYHQGIDENMSVDHCKHSLFGASKLSADVMVQEYGRYFGMKTATFRGGCLTGPTHSGAQLHGFLAYLMKYAVTGEEYRVLGYKGKQVRDNIHSYDLVNCFHEFYLQPRSGEVYNIGGARFSNCSMAEAITLCEEITGNKVQRTYVPENRIGDHIWYVSDTRKFQAHYPRWHHTKGVKEILSEIFDYNRPRWKKSHGPKVA